ncbi:hydroxymethylglutaryl-CoA lyase [Pelagibius sp. Alg239-R121]|uniref:hydroxymethylglutaryl-CoA lyase n=1 Tax=Pelagibius sp. Alg239-R121 TaxID=2993448 RepID=UPI0024A76031|nr:hydroxymethylglutaryl-CoA lyase [Pelagibius sp. Alg239-R121]
MTDQVTVREVGLRDGLQLIQQIVPANNKLDWCRDQVAAGFTEIEVTSFVPPSVIPQFADAAEVLEGAKAIAGLRAAVLVLNLKGALRAFDQGAEKIVFVLSASAAHNLANVRRPIKDSVTAFRELVAERDRRGLKGTVEISGAIATAFGCTIQGEVSERQVFELVEQLAEAGADELNIADTVGYADPAQVRRIYGQVAGMVGKIPLAAHFHDTRGMGLANVVMALEAGVRRFDASLGGLGGCPFAPGASGNIATEDCVYLLESMGLATGIDFNRLLTLREKLDAWLPDEQLYGRLSKARPSKIFDPVTIL